MADRIISDDLLNAVKQYMWVGSTPKFSSPQEVTELCKQLEELPTADDKGKPKLVGGDKAG